MYILSLHECASVGGVLVRPSRGRPLWDSGRPVTSQADVAAALGFEPVPLLPANPCVRLLAYLFVGIAVIGLAYLLWPLIREKEWDSGFLIQTCSNLASQ